MGRASRAEAERHHGEVVKAAARLFRQRDLGAVSLPDVMSEVGLTRGGFYKHFESKDSLVAAAVDEAFAEHLGRIEGMSDRHPDDPASARREFIDFCLSSVHRDDPGTGCPSALASGISRSDPGSAPRTAYIDGVRNLLDELVSRFGEDGADPDTQREAVVGDLSTLVGALLLSRATAGDPLSEEFLTVARRRLASPEPRRQQQASTDPSPRTIGQNIR